MARFLRGIADAPTMAPRARRRNGPSTPRVAPNEMLENRRVLD